MELLYNHTSPETAYVVDDYPYGFRLRCKIRYWLEFKPKQGFRFVSQTTNPKRPGTVWNKPKASTYARFGGAMYLDDVGHVHWAALGEYSTGAEAKAWSDKYRDAVPEAGRGALDAWVAAKVAYDTARTPGDPLNVGLVEARKAFYDVAVANIKKEGENGMTHKVIPYQFWHDPVSGRKFSLYTSWRPEGSVLETKGFTIAWQDGTSGTGRPAFATEAEAEAYLAQMPKGFKGMSMISN